MHHPHELRTICGAVPSRTCVRGARKTFRHIFLVRATRFLILDDTYIGELWKYAPYYVCARTYASRYREFAFYATPLGASILRWLRWFFAGAARWWCSRGKHLMARWIGNLFRALRSPIDKLLAAGWFRLRFVSTPNVRRCLQSISCYRKCVETPRWKPRILFDATRARCTAETLHQRVDNFAPVGIGMTVCLWLNFTKL